MVSTIFLAQSSKPATTVTNTTVSSNEFPIVPLLLFTDGVLLLALVAAIVYGKILIDKSDKKLKFEQFRTRELEKKLKLALEII